MQTLTVFVSQYAVIGGLCNSQFEKSVDFRKQFELGTSNKKTIKTIEQRIFVVSYPIVNVFELI